MVEPSVSLLFFWEKGEWERAHLYGGAAPRERDYWRVHLYGEATSRVFFEQVHLDGEAARSGVRLVSVVWMVMLPIWGVKGGCMCSAGVKKGAGAPIWWSRSEGCWCQVCVVGAKWVRSGPAKRVHLYGEAAYVGRNVV